MTVILRDPDFHNASAPKIQPVAKMQSLPDALAEGERKKDQYGIWVHDTQEGFWESELPKEGVEEKFP